MGPVSPVFSTNSTCTTEGDVAGFLEGRSEPSSFLFLFFSAMVVGCGGRGCTCTAVEVPKFFGRNLGAFAARETTTWLTGPSSRSPNDVQLGTRLSISKVVICTSIVYLHCPHHVQHPGSPCGKCDDQFLQCLRSYLSTAEESRDTDEGPKFRCQQSQTSCIAPLLPTFINTPTDKFTPGFSHSPTHLHRRSSTPFRHLRHNSRYLLPRRLHPPRGSYGSHLHRRYDRLRLAHTPSCRMHHNTNRVIPLLLGPQRLLHPPMVHQRRPS
jgi:hypothetical protein